jgi:hypothetical protein
MPTPALHFCLAVLVTTAPPPLSREHPTTDAPVRQTVERSLPFLGKEGVA